jgi:hypothetical protein
MKKNIRVATLLTVLFLLAHTNKYSFAGEVEIIDVKHQCNNDNVCSFKVTLQHADSGWDHYANQWQILSQDGKVLGTRTLHHPHVNEQPFTRSLSGVKIVPGTRQVKIRARDSVHGLNKKEFIVNIKK